MQKNNLCTMCEHVNFLFCNNQICNNLFCIDKKILYFIKQKLQKISEISHGDIPRRRTNIVGKGFI